MHDLNCLEFLFCLMGSSMGSLFLGFGDIAAFCISFRRLVDICNLAYEAFRDTQWPTFRAVSHIMMLFSFKVYASSVRREGSFTNENIFLLTHNSTLKP